MPYELSDDPKKIAFLSTRIAGTDGVSLEIEKWATVLERMGHRCYYIAGLSDRPAERSRVIAEMHFRHPWVERVNEKCFGHDLRPPDLSSQIHELAWIIKQKLHTVLEELQPDLLIAENCLTIPLNIPLGIAIVETLMERGTPCIAHHHDFYWERERFTVNAVEDYLQAAFPPPLPRLQHVAINTRAAREFSRRVGLSCRVVPNVMDFDNPPPPPDDYVADLREALGLEPDERLILQPTRVVQRKGIEHSIELVRYLQERYRLRCKLVISHASGDEGDAYAQRVRRYADLLGVPIVFAESLVDYRRGRRPDGGKIYSAWDVYSQADLITYPSTYEGFGNAFLEAVYYRKPILCNRYAIYRTDIEPCGFRVCLMDGFLTDEVVDEVYQLLTDEGRRQQIVDHNYEIGRMYFSFARLEAELRAMLAKPRLTAPACR